MVNKTKRLSSFSKWKLAIILIFAIIVLTVIFTYFSKEALPPEVYRIAIDETWYPLQLYEKEEDITIFSKEIALVIAAQEHYSIQILQVDTDNLFTGLDKGEYEGVLSSSIPNEENSENYILSNSYYLTGPVLVVSTSSDVKSLKNLKGKTVGILAGSEQIRLLYANNYLNFVLYDYKNRFQLVNDVSSNVIDGMLLDLIPAYEYTTSSLYRGQLKIVSPPLTNEGLCLIAIKNPESIKLIDRFNEGLKAIKKNGIYAQLLLEWGLFNPEK